MKFDSAPGSLSTHRRKALNLAARKGGVSIDGEAKVSRHMAVVLVREGWATLTNEVLLITKAGRRKLNEAVPAGPPVYLAHAGAIRYRKLPNGRWTVDDESGGSGDYTTDPRRSIDHDLTPGPKPKRAAVAVLVGPADTARFAERARKQERDRRRDAGKLLDAKALDERLELARLVARERHMDFSRDERLIRFMVANGRDDHALRRLVIVETQLGQRAA